MWSLSKTHQVGELIAAIAVVISLIFVGLQIRENTTASQAATYQASVAYNVEILLNLAASPDTARVFNAFVNDDPDGLNADELAQAVFLMSATIRNLENLYIQYEAGMLSETAWEAREPLVRGIVQTPGFEKFLSAPNAINYGGPFMEYAKRIRAESSSSAN